MRAGKCKLLNRPRKAHFIMHRAVCTGAAPPLPQSHSRALRERLILFLLLMMGSHAWAAGHTLVTAMMAPERVPSSRLRLRGRALLQTVNVIDSSRAVWHPITAWINVYSTVLEVLPAL